MSKIENIEFEANQTGGIYYVSGQTNGFDFALIDQTANLINFRNLCFGKRHLIDGEKEWDNFLTKNPKYKATVKNKGFPKFDEDNFGKDIEQEAKTHPIILGEIQFGNWALAYRDLFKVLQANILTDVDTLIYITADGELEQMLSDGIVTFNNIKAIIQEFHKVVTVPIWVIGIDYEIV